MKKRIKSFVKGTLLMILIAIPATFLFCDDCFNSWSISWRVTLMSITIWVVMWWGNALLSQFWRKRLSWIKQPIKTFIAVSLSSIVYTAAAMAGVMFGYGYLFGFDPSSWVLGNMVTAVLIAVFIGLFLHGRSFLLSWRMSAINEEKLKNESLTSRYEVLKNQVNPHFLFNSLNALTNLIYKDQDQAVDFIQKLSKVYRYVLDTRDKEVIDLDTEIKFAESYVFLQQVRFGENLKVNFNINYQGKSKVAPLSLQMLLENAIKHNEISEENPLEISISTEDQNYLTISNNIHKKNTMKSSSSNVGLTNIKARYEYLTDKPVEIIGNEKKFIVKIPLLSLSNESTDN